MLAPSLAEAWAVIGHAVAGCTPVGADVDHTLGLIDFELKRLGTVVPAVFGLDVRNAQRRGFSRAHDAAQYALSKFDPRQAESSAASPFADPDPEQESTGYLLTRVAATPTPSFEHTPGLAALLDLPGTSVLPCLGVNFPRPPTTPMSGTRLPARCWPISCTRPWIESRSPVSWRSVWTTSSAFWGSRSPQKLQPTTRLRLPVPQSSERSAVGQTHHRSHRLLHLGGAAIAHQILLVTRNVGAFQQGEERFEIIER